MNINNIKDSRISDISLLASPKKIKNDLPLSNEIKEFILQQRLDIESIIRGDSKKLLVIVGPCSIHDPKAALEYADYLKSVQDKYKNTLVLVMRTYFSKPRTTIGWKGLVYDPNLNNTFDINNGLKIARETLLNILEKGISCSMEHLDTIIPQYFDDLLSWAAIGARTSESQIHRELASGCSTPIGFKNSTNGNIHIAINAIKSSNLTHHFLGCNDDGDICKITTKGNPYNHLILRGSENGTNYHKENIDEATQKLKENGLNESIVVDASHGNSNKIHKNQINVINSIVKQIIDGNTNIKGVMMESNLLEGKQSIDNKPLVYGKSITDSCINLTDTTMLLNKLHNSIIIRLNKI